MTDVPVSEFRDQDLHSDVDAGDVTCDAFLGGKVKILQPAKGYRAGLDAVLLAAAIPTNGSKTINLLDCGAGVGTVGLCAAARCPNLNTVLVERDPIFVALAKRNLALNDLAARVRVIETDLTVPGNAMAEHGIPDNSFSHVVANPPFFDTGCGTRSPIALKSAGHEMTAADLDGWVRFAARMARADGHLIVIQHVEALPKLLAALEGRFGAVNVVPIHPRAGQAANRVLVAARKGSRAPLRLLAGFTVHKAGHMYTTAADDVLRHGRGLDFFEDERT